jgi:hypothetical protein
MLVCWPCVAGAPCGSDLRAGRLGTAAGMRPSTSPAAVRDRWEREDQAAGQRAAVSLAYVDGNNSSTPSRVRMCGLRNALDVARGRGE